MVVAFDRPEKLVSSSQVQGLCTLDCMVCSWEDASSYYQQSGLLALKLDM